MPLTSLFKYLFSPHEASGEWSEASPMKTARYGCAAATIGTDPLVVVLGGHDGTSETNSMGILYGDNRLSDGCSMVNKRLGCVAATLKVGDNNSNTECIIVAGGHDGTKVLKSVERYHPQLNMWTRCDPMREGRFDAASVALGNRLYVIGGHNGKQVLNSIDVLDGDFSLWTTASRSLMVSRFQCGAVLLGSKIYIVGGADGNNSALDSAEVYDTNCREGSLLPPMTTKRRGCMAAAVGGCIYVFGGHDGKQTLDTAEKYDPTAETWSRLPSMTTKRFGAAIAVTIVEERRSTFWEDDTMERLGSCR